MLQFDMLSIRRLLWFALDVYCFTKMTQILFCQSLSCIAVYNNTDIVLCGPLHVDCGVYRNNRCIFSALVITHICSHEVNVTNVMSGTATCWICLS